jgi:hypothetical protein
MRAPPGRRKSEEMGGKPARGPAERRSQSFCDAFAAGWGSLGTKAWNLGLDFDFDFDEPLAEPAIFFGDEWNGD